MFLHNDSDVINIKKWNIICIYQYNNYWLTTQLRECKILGFGGFISITYSISKNRDYFRIPLHFALYIFLKSYHLFSRLHTAEIRLIQAARNFFLFWNIRGRLQIKILQIHILNNGSVPNKNADVIFALN